MNNALFETASEQPDVNDVFGQRRLSTAFLDQLTPIIARAIAVLSWLALVGRLTHGPLQSDGLLGADNHLLIISACVLIFSVTAIFHSRFSTTVFFTVNSLVVVMLMLGIVFSSGTFLQSGAALLLLFITPVACLWMGVILSMAVSLLLMFTLTVIAYEVFAAETQMQLIINSIVLVITTSWAAFTIGLLVSILRTKQVNLERMRIEYGIQERIDPLTDLPNKQALNHYVNTHPGTYRLHKLMISNFSEIEAVRGHQAAIELVRQVIERAGRNRLIERGSFCYLGVGRVLYLTRAQTEPAEVATEVLASIERKYEVLNQSLHVVCRIGVSGVHPLIADERTELAAAIAEADFAAALTKTGWDLFDASASEKMRRLTSIRNALVYASAGDALSLVYQPKVDMRTGEVVSAEALLRWHDSVFGGVSPHEFIPIAEASGAIESIGDWVLNESLSQLHEWREQGRFPDDFSLAINISSKQLMQSGFAERLLDLITQYDIPTHLVELELTESSLIDNEQVAIQRLKRLRTAGFRVAIDDFGTGFSSLAYIDRLPADVLKVDRSFVMDLPRHQRSFNLTQSIVRIAQRRSLTTVAEGADSAQQVRLLQQLGCDLVQGYYFSPPVSAEMFPSLVEAGFAGKVAVA